MYGSSYEMEATQQWLKHDKWNTLHSKKNTRSCPNATSIPKRWVNTRCAKYNQEEAPAYGTHTKINLK